MTSDEAISAEAIEHEFPEWEIWQAIDGRFCARIRGAVPPVMVHGEDLVDLRDQVVRKVGQLEERAWSEGRQSSAN